MITITYCNELPTSVEEFNKLGYTQFEMFLAAYSPIFYKAIRETVAYLLTVANFDKSKMDGNSRSSRTSLAAGMCRLQTYTAEFFTCPYLRTCA
jgi:hypothetical protein